MPSTKIALTLFCFIEAMSELIWRALGGMPGGPDSAELLNAETTQEIIVVAVVSHQFLPARGASSRFHTSVLANMVLRKLA